MKHKIIITTSQAQPIVYMKGIKPIQRISHSSSDGTFKPTWSTSAIPKLLTIHHTVAKDTVLLTVYTGHSYPSIAYDAQTAFRFHISQILDT